MQITGNPQPITDARLGDYGMFNCMLDSESAYPNWNIKGVDYQITHLPKGYAFKSVSYSKELIVGPLREEMNNTVLYCYVLTFKERIESERAELVIASSSGGK